MLSKIEALKLKAAEKVCKAVGKFIATPEYTFSELIEVYDDWKDIVQQQKAVFVKAKEKVRRGSKPKKV